jgi:hypothetical protein
MFQLKNIKKRKEKEEAMFIIETIQGEFDNKNK